MTGDFRLDRQSDGITIITLSRPHARNALTTELAYRLTDLLDSVEADRDCSVVILTAEGQGFCAGLDLKHVLSGDDAPQDVNNWIALQEVFATLMRRIVRLRQPVIAAVQGAAVGAGFGLALASDIRIGTPSTSFHVGAVKMGLSAGECGISYHLPRLIGAGRAFEIMLTGRPVPADEALAIGLLTAIAPMDDLLKQALQTARSIATNAPYSIKHSKQIMHTNLDAPSLDSALELENHVQVAALLTEDFREAATAFAEKRAPHFTGR
ncbi:enoyl-CoA hydratase/isomerase family protein [Sphingobium sufflavum]|uniref:enoyl-CoA hydratase/isomerase family protein n=1 Tax=Sphingobium sufflavum TaxID=1129547 RepID=UPI001F20A9AE|nr:enoyl-CoA hydratase/isomerase family protein [Sphingobium sufflavum]MCE7797763.1 enoyl-CoA hydratase/isomerase family protein [Sphingobium sufflavum]